MPKRELKINTDNYLYEDTQEDIILKSPSKIPDKGLQDLISLRSINGSDCSHYDIAPTEHQQMLWMMNMPFTFFEEDPALESEAGGMISSFASSVDLNEKLG
jgi:hypothetical protein